MRPNTGHNRSDIQREKQMRLNGSWRWPFEEKPNKNREMLEIIDFINPLFANEIFSVAKA